MTAGRCIACVHWRLWETDKTGQRRWQRMAKLGFGECAAAPFAGQYLPAGGVCDIGRFEPVEAAQMHRRQVKLSEFAEQAKKMVGGMRDEQ